MASKSVTVAVTGHRVLSDPRTAAAGVDRALAEVVRAFPGCAIRVISALAEGADRLVARRILARATNRLTAALPFAADRYRQDFETEASRRDFENLLGSAAEVVTMPPQPTREAAYEAAGMYGLDHADLVIAVWDGEPSQGRGGTGEIVARARERRMPLAWVHAGSGTERGEVRLENWPEVT